ncbi:hypothetical protein [Flammeovirga kamogawensis]|uniref:DUF4424 domain-containing protein n=1 Tax=Flammeovirga kamogawensis TaxID=373891 RepID=A0ABX8H1D8_9BACT|nr:hypothetical protein [Flammeovirga kamogawensis]MBB6462614.1 hypothetical protein [Flammeovirga kamogawensis]QWG09641.1 hypothetical protein KM029_23850 [Flammeovirga kamogawensis]TRX65155.1 hypothetical protein EO216_21750 [Flammeovirga kamogawensis]
MKLLFIVGIICMPIYLNAQEIIKSSISTKSCTTISMGVEEIKLHIAPNSFKNQDGDFVNSDISIVMQLYKDYYDMLFADIPMHDKKGNYISGGMFEITFLSKNTPLKVVREVIVEFPSDEMDNAVYKGFKLDKEESEWNELHSPVLNYATNIASDDDDWGSSAIESINEGNGEWGDDCWCGEESETFKFIGKTLGIKSNGLYNYDYIMDNEDFVPLLVKVSKDIDKVYVHYKGLNTLLYYNVENDGLVGNFGFLKSVKRSDITVFYKKGSQNTDQIVIGKMTNKIDELLSDKNITYQLVFDINNYPVQKSKFISKFEAK